MNRKASILIASMWLLIIFTFLGTAVYKMFSAQMMLSKRLKERSLSYFIARAAIFDAQKELKMNAKSYTSLKDLRIKREKELKSGSFEYYFVDEESKINLNTASSEVLSNFSGMQEDTAQEIATSFLKPFRTIEELLLIDDVDEEDYQIFKDFITVFGEGRINVNTASSEVFSALGLEEDLIAKIIAFRSGPDGIEATEDDAVFESQADISDIFNNSFFLSGAQQELINNLINMQSLDVKSSYYTMVLNVKFLERNIGKYAITITKDAVVGWREF